MIGRTLVQNITEKYNVHWGYLKLPKLYYIPTKCGIDIQGTTEGRSQVQIPHGAFESYMWEHACE